MPHLSRRNFFTGSIASLSLFAVKKLKVVATGGRPGDPDTVGGTIARYSDLGHQVTLLYLNRGEKGCPTKPRKYVAQPVFPRHKKRAKF